MSFGVFLLIAFVMVTIASFIWKYRGLIYFVGIVFLIWLFFKFFFVALIVILGLLIAYFIRRVQENERISFEADRAKQAHQEDVEAWRKEQERKYGSNWYQANRNEQKAEANNARNNQATKLIDYDRRWDSTDPYIILGVREASTFSEIKNQYKFLSKNIILTLQLKQIQMLL
ncbi:DNA-binding protein [Lactococcus lactis]